MPRPAAVRGHRLDLRLLPNHDPVHQEFLWDIMGYQKGDQDHSV